MNKKKEWDYTAQAKFYSNRPNYSINAINKMCYYFFSKNKKGSAVADIGAGTGNLTILLKDYFKKIIAIEPNESMRKIGIEKTKKFSHIKWIEGTGENTYLNDNSIDFVTFGSSFNTTERDQSLKESYRILKKNGLFSCLWNNRDLTIPTQKKVEEIIKRYVPNYSHGVRREQQADIIINSKLFNNLYYFEQPQIINMSLENYLNGWRSVKNDFWDLNTEEGKKLFENIVEDIKEEFKKEEKLKLIYITKVWMAQKQDIKKELNLEESYIY